MSVPQFLRLFAASAAVMFGLDMLWLAVIAKEFYRARLGHLMRADVLWVPALLFYIIYVAALVVFVVEPAIERQSLARAVFLGAFFGLAAYAAYDLTSLALMKDFPPIVAVVDLAWGATLSAAVCGSVYGLSRLGL